MLSVKKSDIVKGNDNVSSLKRQLSKERHKYKDLLFENNSLMHKLCKAEAQLNERFKEIAFLTQELESYRNLKPSDNADGANQSKALVTTPISNLNNNTSAVQKNSALNLRRLKAILRKIDYSKREVYSILSSGYFDASWYLSKNPDVYANRSLRKNPALHFLKYGGFEGRDPSPNFNIASYLEKHPEVKEQGINPLIHFLNNYKQV